MVCLIRLYESLVKRIETPKLSTVSERSQKARNIIKINLLQYNKYLCFYSFSTYTEGLALISLET